MKYDLFEVKPEIAGTYMLIGAVMYAVARKWLIPWISEWIEDH
jgi:hypothetical protein